MPAKILSLLAVLLTTVIAGVATASSPVSPPAKVTVTELPKYPPAASGLGSEGLIFLAVPIDDSDNGALVGPAARKFL